jgi:hypothetical protein
MNIYIQYIYIYIYDDGEEDQEKIDKVTYICMNKYLYYFNYYDYYYDHCYIYACVYGSFHSKDLELQSCL